MATTTSEVGVQMIALERIRTDANIRELGSGDVDALAGSIALLGQITSAIVRPDGDGYVTRSVVSWLIVSESNSAHERQRHPVLAAQQRQRP